MFSLSMSSHSTQEPESLAGQLTIPGSERVRGDRGLPVQEGDTLQLDVHVIETLGTES